MTLFVVTQICVHFRCSVCYLVTQAMDIVYLCNSANEQGQNVDMLDWVDVFVGTYIRI